MIPANWLNSCTCDRSTTCLPKMGLEHNTANDEIRVFTVYLRHYGAFCRLETWSREPICASNWARNMTLQTKKVVYLGSTYIITVQFAASKHYSREPEKADIWTSSYRLHVRKMGPIMNCTKRRNSFIYGRTTPSLCRISAWNMSRANLSNSCTGVGFTIYDTLNGFETLHGKRRNSCVYGRPTS